MGSSKEELEKLIKELEEIKRGKGISSDNDNAGTRLIVGHSLRFKLKCTRIDSIAKQRRNSKKRHAFVVKNRRAFTKNHPQQ